MRLIDADILKEELKAYNMMISNNAGIIGHESRRTYNFIHDNMKSGFEKMIDEQPTIESEDLILNIKQVGVISDMFDERLEMFYEKDTPEIITVASALITILTIMYQLESISLDYYSSTTQSILNRWKEIENKYKKD